RLTGSGLTHDADRLAGVQIEAHAADGVDTTRLAGEGDGEVLDGENRSGHARPPAAEFGSRASRRPSATNAIETVRSVRMRPGKRKTHGAEEITFAPVAMRLPSEMSGICTPKPRNERLVSELTAPTIPRVKLMMSSDAMFGIMWRITILKSPTPM